MIEKSQTNYHLMSSSLSKRTPLFDIQQILNSIRTVDLIPVLLLIASITYVGFIPSQGDFIEIIAPFGIAFASYTYLSIYRTVNISVVLAIGVLLRLLLIFAFPNLSDDIYRFVWDGQLTANGINPYGYLPSEMIERLDSEYTQMLFSKMNSPEYYTIYPPFTQLIFYLSTCMGDDIYASSYLIKVCFFIAEMCTLFGIVKILDHLNMKKGLAAIYFLNPLVLLEGLGNLHFEVIMVSFLVWAIYFSFVKKKLLLAAVFFTLSIASKLLPLMFLPFFLFHLRGNDRVKFFLYGIAMCVVAFLPIALGLDFANFATSIDLYFQKFEFNASIYYILRYIGQVWSGYNLIHYIGPLLGVVAVVLIVKKALVSEYDIKSFITFCFYSFCIYLLLATTVHPWYLCVPILFSVFVSSRWVVVWSFAIMLSYINYSYDPFYENLWIVTIEYIMVLIVYLISSYRQDKRLSNI